MLTDLNKLSTKELREFIKFVHSPYFNKYKTVTDLCDFLETRHPNITKDDIDNKFISQMIYAEERVNDTKVRKLKSDTHNLFNKFLIHSALEKDIFLNEMLLLREYREKSFSREFNIRSKKLKKVYEKSFVRNVNIYSSMLQINEEEFYHMHESNDNKLIYSYQSRALSLDYYIAAKKLANFIEEIISEVYITKKLKVEKTFYNDVLNFVEKNIKDIRASHPYIYINYLMVKFFENYDIKYPYEIKKYQKLNSSRFDTKLKIYFDDSVKSIYMKLFTKSKGDEKVIRNELFSICDRLYMHKAPSYLKYFKDNLKSFEFMVIVNLGCTLGKFEWTKEFIEKYGDRLSDENSDDCYNISLANYFLTTKDFKNSIIYSNKVSKKVAHFYYTSRMSMLKCYYEMDDDSGIQYSFDNIKQYLRRNNSINSYDVQILKPFVSFFSDFLKVKNSAHDRSLRKDKAGFLIKKIEDYKDILYYRNWFLRKLREM